MLELIEKKTPITLMLLHLRKQPPGPVRYLRKAFTHHLPPVVKKNTLFFSRTLILTINNLVIKELVAENRFLKNTSTWLLLRSKFYSEFDSMFCLHKIRILQKGFSQLSFIWSVKWWVSLKLWNNHSRDWINNFPFSSRHQAASHCSGCQTIWKQTTSKYF